MTELQAPELDYDDFAGVDLRGKIAVVLAKAPPRWNPGDFFGEMFGKKLSAGQARLT